MVKYWSVEPNGKAKYHFLFVGKGCDQQNVCDTELPYEPATKFETAGKILNRINF